jgi:hypothetical protein
MEAVLPAELLYGILLRLPASDLLTRASKVNRRWHTLAWRILKGFSFRRGTPLMAAVDHLERFSLLSSIQNVSLLHPDMSDLLALRRLTSLHSLSVWCNAEDSVCRIISSVQMLPELGSLKITNAHADLNENIVPLCQITQIDLRICSGLAVHTISQICWCMPALQYLEITGPVVEDLHSRELECVSLLKELQSLKLPQLQVWFPVASSKLFSGEYSIYFVP